MSWAGVDDGRLVVDPGLRRGVRMEHTARLAVANALIVSVPGVVPVQSKDDLPLGGR